MKKFLRSLALAAGLSLGGFGLAFSTNLALLTNQTVINPSVLADLNQLIININASLAPLGLNVINTAQTTFAPEGYVYRIVGPIYSTAATTLTTLASFTLPANSFDIAGRTVKIHAAFHSANNSDNKTYNCSFSSVSLTSAVLADTGLKGGGVCDLLVTEGVTANTQMVSGSMIIGSTPSIAVLLPLTQVGTVSSGLTAWVGSVDGSASAGDSMFDEFTVEYGN